MTARAPRLWLVRHAQVLAAPGLCYGASDLLADAAATKTAAQALSAQWAGGGGPSGAGRLPVWVSPLRRCVQLAQALQGLHPELRWRSDARLRELDFGRWEGRPWDAIGRAEFDRWMDDFGHACPGGDGESVAALMARVGQAWDAWQASGRDALWITHAGVMRAALLLSQGQRMPSSAADWPTQALDFGQVLVLNPTQPSV